MPDSPSFTPELRAAVMLFRQDQLTAEIVTELEKRGIQSVVLKGPSIAEWLYRGELRLYGDSDLLVSPADWTRAHAALVELGFVDGLGPLDHPGMQSFSGYPWVRGRTQHVDMHCTLWGAGAPPEKVWEALLAASRPKAVGGRTVQVLSPVALTMHVALHAAQDGPDAAKPREDLERAIAQVPDAIWQAAAGLALELDAVGAFAEGLRSVPAGAELARRLNVSAPGSVEARLRGSYVPMAMGVEHFVQTKGVRPKLRLLAREMAPTPAFMRWWTPLARRGKLGLALSYPWRLIWFVQHLWPALRTWRRAHKAAEQPAGTSHGGSLRVAWIGPTPGEYGGAPYVGTQLLCELSRAGFEVDCFVAAPLDHVPKTLIGRPGLRFVCVESGWKWDRWYSRGPMRAFFSGNLTRAAMQFRLANLIFQRHRERPYDVVYQFSQVELFPLRRRRRQLPPLVVHPETHAAGELLWHRRETDLSRRCESRTKRTIVRLMLRGRAAMQRRDLALPARVIAPSRRFGNYLARDYGILPERIGVVPNPVDLGRFPMRSAVPVDGPVRLLFVSRMSARKGVEMIVELSHRLSDLAGRVRIEAVGGPTTWSDYQPLLRELNRDTAAFLGSLPPRQLGVLYRAAHALLQPSHYEPFAITVGEALASGMPVVASDEVGAVDGVDPEVCTVFPAGDMDAFEAAVRAEVERLERDFPMERARLARAEAERLFAADRVTAELVAQLERALGRLPDARPNGRPDADRPRVGTGTAA
jgi:glycosyltransferase involved in cell wall biosynthesis